MSHQSKMATSLAHNFHDDRGHNFKEQLKSKRKSQSGSCSTATMRLRGLRRSTQAPSDHAGDNPSDRMTGHPQYSSTTTMNTMMTTSEDSETVMALDGIAEKGVEVDEDLIYTELSDDIYSIIYTAKSRSAAFSFAVFVFLFQMTVIGLILTDLIDASNTFNPMQIPPGVVTEVRIAQCLALLLSVAMQQDIITSLIFLHDGYNEEVLNSVSSANFQKWLLAAICQFLAGASLLVALFILMMQSTEVISLFLNFAALHFVSEIDNVGFAMAKLGFITDSVQNETKRVRDLKVPSRSTSNIFRRVMLCGLMAGYAYVVISQRSGKFLPQSLRVQFSDDYQPFLPLFSGVYDQTKDDVVNGRVIYLERETRLGMFGYCKENRVWTFSVGNMDPCEDWLACSPETFSFDIASTAPSEWLVLSNTKSGELGKTVPIPSFALSSNDCFRNDGLCVHGRCNDNKCVCDEGHYGLRCEFDAPCPHLQIDFRTMPFPSSDYGPIPYTFDILLRSDNYPVEVYHRPVYVYNSDGFFDIILFQGRRWVLTNSDLLNITDSESFLSATDLAEYFATDYVGIYTQTMGYFVTDSMDVDTPRDSFTPEGLEWYRIKMNRDETIDFDDIDMTQPLGTAMLCAVCDEFENQCFFDGVCNEFGKCECSGKHAGALCELDAGAKVEYLEEDEVGGRN